MTGDTPERVELYDTERRAGAAHAAALKAQAEVGGLCFEVFLPSEMALWLLDLIETGVFLDPGEAVFSFLCREMLQRAAEYAENNPRPPIPLETIKAELEARLAAPLPPAAVWDASTAARPGADVPDPARSPP